MLTGEIHKKVGSTQNEHANNVHKEYTLHIATEKVRLSYFSSYSAK